MTLRLIRWIMQSWQRVEFFYTFLAGTWAPRIQMDLLPGIACAAHFVILADREPETLDDYVNGGRAVQRFWLTATKLNLQLLPEMTPLIFAGYVREGARFSRAEGAWSLTEHLNVQLDNLVGGTISRQAVFWGESALHQCLKHGRRGCH